jgi:two-component system response regulator FlrC
MIGLSSTAAAENPALSTWLKGAGLAVEILDAATAPSAGPFIYADGEQKAATPRDVVIAIREGHPEFTPATTEAPAFVAFGYEDMAFGNALIAELVRPLHRPACGEPASARSLELAARVATSDASILVLGETGTGKEGIARYIHNVSPRAKGPFTAVNCAALPETMLEAILFGHRKGSFTGAASDGEGLFRAAHGGTLLLDEIAEMPLGLQAKLLRALQEGEVVPIGATQPIKVDVRVIACANRDLPSEVAEGRFRADLYYRLNVFPLALRPLRERLDDIAPLAFAMLLRHTPFGQTVPWIGDAALAMLKLHGWPGNVRELENVMRRAILFAHGAAELKPEHISFDSPARLVSNEPAPVRDIQVHEIPSGRRRLSNIVQISEARAIMETLEACGGNRVAAASQLGISERTLRYRLASFREAGLAVAGAAR